MVELTDSTFSGSLDAMRAFLLTAAFTAAASTVGAATLTERYSSFFAFGDSLSDNGNVFAATPNEAINVKIPSWPYMGGRFSNGPVWTDSLIGEFASANLPAAGLAFGLANAGFDGPSADLFEQVGLFDLGGFSASTGERPLATLWFGANDIFRAVDSGFPAPAVSSVGTAAAAAVVNGVGALAARGFSDFLVLNLPDLGLVPAYATTDFADEASAGSAAFNAALQLAVGALSASVNVTLLDIDALFSDLRANPDDYGVGITAEACFSGDAVSISLGLVQGCADASAYAFFDNVHPTATIHAEIATAARAALGARVAPVPIGPALPMLATALAVLAIASRRKGRQTF